MVYVMWENGFFNQIAITPSSMHQSELAEYTGD